MRAEPAIVRMTHPRSVSEALHDLARDGAVAVAGATWVMRAPIRHEVPAECFVALAGIDGFDRLEMAEDAISIGPLATHDRLASNLPETPGLRALRQAAGNAANPGIRRIATIGGNLCASDFAASDFAPALLSLDASVEISDVAGSRPVPIENFLSHRTTLDGPWLVSGIVVPRNAHLSAHERLPMRRAGDYPCAIVSISVELDDAGRVRNSRIGVGAVEAVARRWLNLEQALEGGVLESARAEEAAKDMLADFSGRDAIDAPGWYRTSVLPVLVRRAFDSIRAEHARSKA